MMPQRHAPPQAAGATSQNRAKPPFSAASTRGTLFPSGWHGGCPCSVTEQTEERNGSMRLILTMTDSHKRVAFLCLLSFLAMC